MQRLTNVDIDDLERILKDADHWNEHDESVFVDLRRYKAALEKIRDSFPMAGHVARHALADDEEGET